MRQLMSNKEVARRIPAHAFSRLVRPQEDIAL